MVFHQPISKICDSQIGSFPHGIGVNTKNHWNHHLVIESQVDPQESSFTPHYCAVEDAKHHLWRHWLWALRGGMAGQQEFSMIHGWIPLMECAKSRTLELHILLRWNTPEWNIIRGRNTYINTYPCHHVSSINVCGWWHSLTVSMVPSRWSGHREKNIFEDLEDSDVDHISKKTSKNLEKRYPFRKDSPKLTPTNFGGIKCPVTTHFWPTQNTFA